MKTLLLLLTLFFGAAATDDQCTVCQDGSPSPLPDKMIDFPGVGIELDCFTAEELISTLFTKDVEECVLVHQLSSICGCPIREDACHLCADKSSVVAGTGDPDATLPVAAHFFLGTPPTCEMMEAYLHSFKDTESMCTYGRYHAALACGCPYNPGQDSYDQNTFDDHVNSVPDGDLIDLTLLNVDMFGDRGPDGERRYSMHHKLTRWASILSIFGAVAVILDNIKRRDRFSKNVYNQIVVAMAVADIVYSAAASLLTISMPTDDQFDVYGEQGTEGTCKAQGWALQFGGLTSWFLNASLATYYVLIIVYGMKTARLKQLRKYLIGIPLLLGMAFACASIPFIVPIFATCHLNPPLSVLSDAIADLLGYSKTWYPFALLFIVPGYLVIVYCTVALAWVFWYVRKVDKMNASNRELSARSSRLPSTNSNMRSESAMPDAAFPLPSVRSRKERKIKMQLAVFWQSFFYLSALYISWFFYLGITVQLEEQLADYSLMNIALFLVHLNGFLNSLIYFRPRMSKQATALLQKYQVAFLIRPTAHPTRGDSFPVIRPLEGNSLDPEDALMSRNEFEAISTTTPSCRLASIQEENAEDLP